MGLAQCYVKTAGRRGGGAALLERALALPREDTTGPAVAEAELTLAEALDATHARGARALELARDAEATYAKDAAGARDQASLAEARAWIAKRTRAGRLSSHAVEVSIASRAETVFARAAQICRDEPPRRRPSMITRALVTGAGGPASPSCRPSRSPAGEDRQRGRARRPTWRGQRRAGRRGRRRRAVRRRLAWQRRDDGTRGGRRDRRRGRRLDAPAPDARPARALVLAPQLPLGHERDRAAALRAAHRPGPGRRVHRPRVLGLRASPLREPPRLEHGEPEDRRRLREVEGPRRPLGRRAHRVLERPAADRPEPRRGGADRRRAVPGRLERRRRGARRR